MPPKPTEAPPLPPVDEDTPHQAEMVKEKPEKEVPLVRKPPPPRSHAPLPPTGKDERKEGGKEVGQQSMSGDGHPSSQKGSPTTNRALPRRVKHLHEADNGQKEEEQETEERKKVPRPPPPRTGAAAVRPSPPLARKTETGSSPRPARAGSGQFLGVG